MIVVAVLLLGTISLLQLPVGLLPNLANPGITIITRYSGISAEKIEELITIPIERQVSDISGIEKIVSVSSEGESRIDLTFDHNADIKIKILDASERIHTIKDSFPREVEDPSIVQYDPNDRPVFTVSFSSKNLDLKQLRELIDQKVKLKYERVEGVSEVFVGGGFEREIQILADPGRLVAHRIAVGSVADSVAKGNVYATAGKLPGIRERFVYTEAKFTSLSEIKSSYFRRPGKDGGLIQVGQVADVEDRFRDPGTVARTNGEERVTVYIEKAGNANTLAITDTCEAITAALAFKDIETHISYNQGTSIRRAIKQVSTSCVHGIIIATFVLYGFMRRAGITLLVALNIPASILSTFFLMYMSGLEINVMSLSGLALGSGMLIDNSIVVSEAIDRRLALGESRSVAILQATFSVSVEIISATLCTIVVFIPLLFTDPETRILYTGFSLTVVYSLLASLVFSLTVLPALMLAFLNWKRPELGGSLGEFMTFIGNVESQYDRLTQAFTIERLTEAYRRFIGQLFANPARFLIVLAFLLVSSPFLFWGLKKEYMSPIDSDDIEASVDLDTGTHLEKTESLVRTIEEKIRKHPGVREVSSKIEKSHATLAIKSSGSVDSEDLISGLKTLTDQDKDAFVYYTQSGEVSSGRELDIEFYGDDFVSLKKIAQETASTIQSSVPGVEQVVLRFREGKKDFLIYPSKAKLGVNQISVADVGSTLRQLLSGTIITKFYDRDREVDVRLRAPPESLDSLDKISQLQLPLEGRAVPLSSIARFVEGEGETRMWRKNKRRTVSITVKIQKRSIEDVALDISRLLANRNWSADTIYAFGDEFERIKANQRQMVYAVTLSLVVIYLLLCCLFESLSQPLIIMIAVPLTIAGVVAFLALSRMTVTISVYIGLIMLGGIVVNNSILLVSTINSMVGSAISGDALKSAIFDAAVRRIRPIIMTTMVTVLGMLPMALDFSEGSGLWRPLAITVSVGLTLSVFITLILVPYASLIYYSRFRRNEGL
ncbi:MAG: efflux RND transporter permease subunit [Spirochaetia bacterium]|nr:efflux RND transporter permease subunit [Spirochaetia bacterium]